MLVRVVEAGAAQLLSLSPRNFERGSEQADPIAPLFVSVGDKSSANAYHMFLVFSRLFLCCFFFLREVAKNDRQK